MSFPPIKIYSSSSSISFPDHELRVGEIAREMGFTNVSLSHQIIAMQKYVPRAHTGLFEKYFVINSMVVFL